MNEETSKGTICTDERGNKIEKMLCALTDTVSMVIVRTEKRLAKLEGRLEKLERLTEEKP